MTEVEIRRAEEADFAEVISLLRVSLSKGDDPRYEAFFRWKHSENPFGQSPSWVATAAGQVVGFRTFMRWEFQRGGEVVRAVRAVDTATAPEFRGQGIFNRLTRTALLDLRAEGVDLVFNTPNDQSRPGYLKMGWRLVGRLPVLVSPRSLLSVPRVLGARTAAQIWSEPVDVGVPVADVVPAMVDDRTGDPVVLRTRRTTEFLAWRYGFQPLCYRAIQTGDAVAVFRIRRRGAAREAVIADDTARDAGARKRLLGAVFRATSADYALLLGRRTLLRRGIPVPGMGPTLTCLPLSRDEVPPLSAWGLSLGDIELF